MEAAKKLGIAEQTLIRWRKEYGGLRVDQARRFKELEKENIRLKRLVADLSLDKAILKDAASGSSEDCVIPITSSLETVNTAINFLIQNCVATVFHATSKNFLVRLACIPAHYSSATYSSDCSPNSRAFSSITCCRSDCSSCSGT